MPGYSVLMRKEDAKVFDEELLCASCHYLLRKPQQVKECGHLYCNDCLHDIIGRVQKCVVGDCGVYIYSVDETFLDRAKQREVMSVPVLCYNIKCPWSGTLRELETKHVSECKFIKCQHDGCEETFDDQEALMKHETGCRYRPISCKFEHVGCPLVGNKQKLIEHCRENVVEHIALLHARLPSIEKQVPNNDEAKIIDLETSLKAVSEELAKLESQNRSGNCSSRAKGGAKSKTAMTMELSKEMQANMAGLVGKLGRLQGQQAEMKRQAMRRESFIRKNSKRHQKKQEAAARKLIDLEMQLLQRDRALDEVHNLIAMKELATYNGVLCWKIGDFARCRCEAINEGVFLYSHYFYTSRYGYKLRARIYLNGDGLGRGTHISVFFCICKGDFDAILEWPFNRKVSLKIIDQNCIEDIVDAIVPYMQSPVYMRPTALMNTPSGREKFMDLRLLDDPDRAYVKDDCLFVQISVGASQALL